MKRTVTVTLLLLGAFGAGALAQEILTFTVPVSKPSQTTFRVEKITIDVIAKSVYVEWQWNLGEKGAASYPTPVPSDHLTQPSGATLITTLNKANFSGANTSLVNRVITRLQTDGYIGAGVIAGTPD